MQEIKYFCLKSIDKKFSEYIFWIYFKAAYTVNVESWENLLFAYAKTKAQINCAVISQLISTFVFAS